MQPGPFNKNIQNQKFYNSIADAVMNINRKTEEAKIEDSPISELKMPAKDAKGNVNSRKVRAAFAKGADNASTKAVASLGKISAELGKSKSDATGMWNAVDNSIDHEDRSDDRKRKARKEEVEVEEGKLVDRVMKKRKEMKNKGTLPGSDGY